jgi:hypothetical protein
MKPGKIDGTLVLTSKHASRRMQQRGIPPWVVTWLVEFSQIRYDHRGGIMYYFDRRSRRNLEREVGSRLVARLSDYLNVYVVVSSRDEAVVTVGHRYRRLSTTKRP